MPTKLVATGIGITTAIGQGKEEYATKLLAGAHSFGKLQREGRTGASQFIGAEIAAFTIPETVSKRLLRNTSLSARLVLTTVSEAWEDAQLSNEKEGRIGLIIGGSNVQQREIFLLHKRYADKMEFITPTYAFSYMDTDMCAICTEHFGIHAMAHTIGGASASGQLAVIKAAQAVQSGEVDICIAVGAMMDLSYPELQSFQAIGALGSKKFSPEFASRPFDLDRDGFIYSEGCAAVVIESEQSFQRRCKTSKPYASIEGWGVYMDGHRNPDSSSEGQMKAIAMALDQARIKTNAINYINPHGSGSPLGDETELKALSASGLDHAKINTTKSIVGHALTAAGTIEIVTSLLQMKTGKLHPCRNLQQPIDKNWNWVGPAAEEFRITYALNMSLGFGGINTAFCMKNSFN